MASSHRDVGQRKSRMVNTNDCIIYEGSFDKDGYGKTVHEGRDVRAHRLSWEHEFGPIPDGLWVLHHCDNPPCINTDHLFLGTALDNARDCTSKNRNIQKNKTHCYKGHEFNEKNTRFTKTGHRHCRPCMAAHQIKYVARRKVRLAKESAA